jgi:uncharacterized protein with von Willebrand factor type A (vWA) domain
MIGASPPDASRQMVGFCRALRRSGIAVTVGEEMDASRAVLALPALRLDDFHDACKVALLKDPERAQAFDAVFRSYWSKDPVLQEILENELDRPRPGMTHVPRGADLMEARTEDRVEERAGVDVARAIRLVLYSSDAPSRPRALRTVERERLKTMERRARHLRRRIATLPGRRYRSSGHGQVDFRAAARKSLRYAGEWVDLPRRDRRILKTRLLVVWDVSGSMEEHQVEHLGLVYAIQRLSRHARVFAFGTDLHEITAHLRAQPYPGAVARMESLFTSWGGGTRIGESLAAVNRDVGSWVDRRTVVLILSDGWDMGNLDLLRDELSRLRRRSRFLVWLNPNASEPGFRPEAAGMRAALPFVDLLLSTDVLSSPAAFRRELGPSLAPLS